MRVADLFNVKIHTAERLLNSVNGNPRFKVTLVEPNGVHVGTYNTQTDASCNYKVTNYLHGERLNVWLSKRGTIEYLAKIS